jgi:hypothetical protein
MEVATWTQLGIHSKRTVHTFQRVMQLTFHRISYSATAVILVNVLGFFDPLRALIKSSIAHGFINARNENLIDFVDCPPGADPVTFDWGAAALNTMDNWSPSGPGLFAWELRLPGGNNLDLS